MRKLAQTGLHRGVNMFAHVCARICANKFKTAHKFAMVYMRKHNVCAYLRKVCASFTHVKPIWGRGQIAPDPLPRKRRLRSVCAGLRSVCAMFAHVFLCKPLSANMRKQKFHFMFTHVYACLRMFSQCLRNVYAFQLVSANTAQYSSNVGACLRMFTHSHVYACLCIYAYLRILTQFLRIFVCSCNFYIFTQFTQCCVFTQLARIYEYSTPENIFARRGRGRYMSRDQLYLKKLFAHQIRACKLGYTQ
jgi:hypothetical protein